MLVGREINFMIRKIIFCLGTLLSLNGIVLSQNVVAVFITGNDSSAEKMVFGTKFVAAISNHSEYKAVEYTELFFEKLDKDTSFLSSGNLSNNVILQLGKEFEVDFLCVIDISTLWEEKFIRTKLMSINNGEILKVSNINDTWNDMDGLLKVVDSLSVEVIETIKNGNKEQIGPKVIIINKQTYEVMPYDMDGHTWQDAMDVCDNLTIYGKDDWYLPGKKELIEVYKNRDEIGGFIGDWYWSGTEVNGISAWNLCFNGGYGGITNKVVSRRVRCVRNGLK